MTDEYNEKETPEQDPDNPTAQDHECQFCHESFGSEEEMREHVEAEHSSVEKSSDGD
ncbi:hypothetical protein [Halogeometricum luteum]|uniref:C2H2-type domain-containing protein n=1 Tax=Halogeometricum luteum TaxID=2950537 RepID=A0ABU2G691_9EURY|nr:hypothetical protein [Halogeometricum sp. S3BR5-2]MDS0295673.1 hypothetical protein [Halogeometricum sp. S3BR5-2]